jgi:hypothetical protein
MRKLDAVFFENNMATVAQEKEASFFYCSTGIPCGTEKEASFFYCSTGIPCGTMCFHQASAKGG